MPTKSPAGKKPRTTRKKTVAPKKRPTATKRKKSVRKKKVNVSPLLAVAIAAALIFLLVILPHRNRPCADETGAQVPGIPFSSFGIDISHNNSGPILWDSLMVLTDNEGRTIKDLQAARHTRPVKFVFIKATEGAAMRDPKFKTLWAEAGEHDIKRGAYHFFRSSKDGAVQARSFIATVGDLRHSDLPPVLDIETIHRGCSHKALNERALVWLKDVEEHYRRTPIVYTSDDFAKNVLSKEITDNYPIWIAHYKAERPIFQDWEYWQFTDKALVYGIQEPVDLNVRK